MSREFAGQRVWVTGAGRGIGYATAVLFQEAGAEVLGIDIAFDASFYPYETYCLDLSDTSALTRFCQQWCLDEGLAPEVVVHAAGTLRIGAIDTLTVSDWQHCMGINAEAAFHLLRLLAPYFKQRRSGTIVCVGSNAAHVPRIDMAAYCASKAALKSVCQTVGLELAPFGVRCNLVSPGSTDTPMQQGMWEDQQGAQRVIDGMPEKFKLGIPLGKMAQPLEIAQAIFFLASSKAGHITMHDLVIDGGATLSA